MDIRPRLIPTALVALVLLALALAPGAVAATPAPVPPEECPQPPPEFAIDAREAFRVASAEPKVAATSAEHGRLEARIEAKPEDGRWQVGFFDGETERVVVFVDPASGAIKESWTGYQVAWQMARGYEGQFGHVLNAPYVWIPLALAFLAGLLDFRRPWRIAHLDLLVLLSFGVSQVFFNRGEIGLSVPLAYPPLLYLLCRLLWIGFRGPGAGLRPSAPIAWLAVATVFLLGFRIALNVADSGVIDVGYAGVIGADRIVDGEPIYDSFPDDNPTGDTYGPANYSAYGPFELALPWSGEWDELAAGHAAAIFFDLATVAGLFLCGGRLRPAGGRGLLGPGRDGRALGIVLAFAWCAYPYTAFALQSNANDSLVAALLVWSFVVFASPLGRGALLGLAGAVKFAPLALAPLFAAGERGFADRLDRPLARRSALLFAAAFVAALVLMLAHPAVDPGLATFWERTVENQLDRESPFSVWGQVSGVGGLQTLVLGGSAALALGLAFVPRRRTPGRLAALAAAILIAGQLALDHWFYLYIPWFAGLCLIALMPEAEEPAADRST